MRLKPVLTLAAVALALSLLLFGRQAFASTEIERESAVASRFDRLDPAQKICRIYGKVWGMSPNTRDGFDHVFGKAFLGQFWVQNGRIVVATKGEIDANLAPRGARIESGSPLAVVADKFVGWSTFSDGGRWATEYPSDGLVIQLRSNEHNAASFGKQGKAYETIRASFKFSGPLCASIASRPGDFSGTAPYPEKTLISQVGLMYIAYLSGNTVMSVRDWQKEVLLAVPHIERLR